jgi:hypothetical protein
MDFEHFTQLLLGQSLALALLWGVANKALYLNIQSFMRDTILKKPTGKLTRKK